MQRTRHLLRLVIALLVVFTAAAPPVLACSDDCQMSEAIHGCQAPSALTHDCGMPLRIGLDDRCCDETVVQPLRVAASELSLASLVIEAPAPSAVTATPVTVDAVAIDASPPAVWPSGRSLLSLHQTLLI